MQLENFLKSFVTTIIGLALMALAVYELYEAWMTDLKMEWNDWLQILISGVGGYALMHMKDKISEWISSLVTAAIDKFKNKP